MDVDEKLLKQVFEMAKIGLTMEQTGRILGRARRSLYEDFAKHPELKRAFQEGVECGIDEISQTAFQLAKSGKVPAMTMFWLKCRARWKEVQHVEHTVTKSLEDLIVEARETKEITGKTD